jgi:antagonist of KipI
MALIVVRPGLLTTVQDLGRWGYQGSGVPVAGPMDAYSHRRANRLVGNPEEAAALEITMIGPELQADADVVCVLSGGQFDATLNGEAIDVTRPFVVSAGSRLRFGARRTGARASLAVAGGFDLPLVFGSRATSVVARMGPFGGRPLVAGDVLPIIRKADRASAPAAALALPRGGARLRIIRGPHADMFTSTAQATLTASRFVVTPESNRMGYRLEGLPLAHTGGADILSDATPMGSLQVPASGQPILLMADRQTTGGYPRIATVISADLPIAGQLAPGDWIEFAECTRTAAVEALREQEAALRGWGRGRG